ncbi:hypothetical protein K474DRAFT_1306696 [Panus rudis PR-1116 ss-1]|nr:hypothetical protein K474DRAFT_1306696 [Panus rudis PR-1116 ss-1]
MERIQESERIERRHGLGGAYRLFYLHSDHSIPSGVFLAPRSFFLVPYSSFYSLDSLREKKSRVSTILTHPETRIRQEPFDVKNDHSDPPSSPSSNAYATITITQKKRKTQTHLKQLPPRIEILSRSRRPHRIPIPTRSRNINPLQRIPIAKRVPRTPIRVSMRMRRRTRRRRRKRLIIETVEPQLVERREFSPD